MTETQYKVVQAIGTPVRLPGRLPFVANALYPQNKRAAAVDLDNDPDNSTGNGGWGARIRRYHGEGQRNQLRHMPGYSLNWNGPLLIAKIRQAQPAAIADVTTAAAEAAAANTPVDTGRAQRSVQALPATRHGNRTGARWGSFGVPYYIFLELRGNMLRNAADATLSEIGRRTRFNHLQAGGTIGPPGAV